MAMASSPASSGADTTPFMNGSMLCENCSHCACCLPADRGPEPASSPDRLPLLLLAAVLLLLPLMQYFDPLLVLQCAASGPGGTTGSTGSPIQ